MRADNPWIVVLISVFTSGVGGIIINAIAQRRKLGSETKKTDADAASIIQKVAADMVTDYEEREKRMQSKLDTQSEEIEALKNELETLKGQHTAEVGRRQRLQSQVDRLEAREIAAESAWEKWADQVEAKLREAGVNFVLPRPRFRRRTT